MISVPILGLGFLVGMQHAFEPDHVAAVSSIAARDTRIADIVKHGLTWGLGHSLTLFSFAGAAIVLDWAIPDILAQPLEAAVGIMVVGLGARVLWRLWRDRVPSHQCGHGIQLIHQHATASCRIGANAKDDRGHGFRWRSLAVGLMHGMAGSAALLVLTVSRVADPVQGVGYVALFGLGSMMGMGALSSIIAVPLVASARLLTSLHRTLQVAVGLITVGIGATTIYAVVVDAVASVS